jgi:hypothetical protein
MEKGYCVIRREWPGSGQPADDQQRENERRKELCEWLFLLEKLNPVSVPDALETVRPSNNRWSLPISNGKIEKEKKKKFNTRS